MSPQLVGGKKLWATRKISKADIQTAREWYREKATGVQTVNANKIYDADQAGRQFKRFTGSNIGSMMLFWYDAKNKDTLKYWDQHPLIFPFNEDSKHFWGINLHYIDLFVRARLMDALYKIAQVNKNNEIVRLNLSYSALKGVSRMPLYKPCIKCYLKSYVQSNFMYIAPSEWDLVAFLPLQRFTQSTGRVWSESLKKI